MSRLLLALVVSVPLLGGLAGCHHHGHDGRDRHRHGGYRHRDYDRHDGHRHDRGWRGDYHGRGHRHHDGHRHHRHYH